MNLQDELLSSGVANGMCEKFQNEWNNPDIPTLCNMYFKGQDFCIEKDWPSVEWLDKNLKGQTSRYGIFINEEADSDAGFRRIALLGNSKVKAYVSSMCDITVRHDSELHLYAGDNSFCYVSLYDNAKLFIHQHGFKARICCSHFGGTIENIELIDKYNKKY